MASVLTSLVVSFLLGCQAAPTSPPASESIAPRPAGDAGLASGLYWRPSATSGGRWALLLPGASGLKVFDDDGHYFRVADVLNRRGFDVLVVDYRRAYKAAANHPSVPTGNKIAWVVEQSLAWAQQERKIAPGSPGAVIAWSLGAEGLWPLLPDHDKTSAMGIKAAAVYYPSDEDSTPLATSVPLLILAGDKDDVTPAAEIQRLVHSANSRDIELHLYAGANHGFDISSIQLPKTIRLLPLIGPSGTFGYDKAAADDAWATLEHFLDQFVRSGSSPEHQSATNSSASATPRR